ncbi:MAG: hypothetical protein HKN23_11200 [Verrucomicrobiales bacterium]|nr:hypothetical protein [Verrucomicrobiales bacterium]
MVTVPVKFFLTACLLVPALPAFCQGPVERTETILTIPIGQPVDQKLYADSQNACAAACLLMQFQNGTPAMQQRYAELVGSDHEAKLRAVVDKFFKNKRSTVDPKSPRWGPHGVVPVDLAAAANEWLGAPNGELTGDWLDRRNEAEMGAEFAARIHGKFRDSIRAGVPPILSLRSFMVREKDDESGDLEWKIGNHHFVLVTEVPEILVPKDKAARVEGAFGFRAGVIDPNGGIRTEAHIFVEPNVQPFAALKGNSKAGFWRSGRSFLLVSAPAVKAVRPVNSEWSERIVVIANYLIGDFNED